MHDGSSVLCCTDGTVGGGYVYCLQAHPFGAAGRQLRRAVCAAADAAGRAVPLLLSFRTRHVAGTPGVVEHNHWQMRPPACAGLVARAALHAIQLLWP